MACFPKIDQPCPLGIDEQKRIDGWCGRCAKNVHSLDGMSGDDRRALLRGASGPICVSYRRPVARGSGVGLGAALAMSMSASALAIDGLPSTSATDVAQSSVETAAAADATQLDFLTGGVSHPADAEWIDDSDLPDLPMISAAAQPDP